MQNTVPELENRIGYWMAVIALRNVSSGDDTLRQLRPFYVSPGSTSAVENRQKCV
jgi:hypothetical protein